MTMSITGIIGISTTGVSNLSMQDQLVSRARTPSRRR